jgi:hypothetical protein
MESSDATASVYAEAKGEYTKQLTLFTVPSFHRFFMTLLQQAAAEEPQAKRQLWKFQELLSQIPEWNMDKVQREVNRLVTEINCEYLEELVTAVFIAHTKVLTAIRIGSKNKRVQITIPRLEHFIHRALSECSRLLWSSAYLFHNDLSPVEKQKNHRQIEQLLNDGILQAIRGLLPVKNILKDYLAEPDGEEEKEDEKEDEDEDEKDEKDEKDDHKSAQEAPLIPQDEAAFAVSEEKVISTDQESTLPSLQHQDSVLEQPIIPLEETQTLSTPSSIPAPIQAHPEATPTEPLPSISAPLHPSAPPAPVPTHVAPPTLTQPTTPTFVVDTEPTVRFTEYNQVIQQKGPMTDISYQHTTHEPPEDDGLEFLDDEAGELSDVEDLDQGAPEPLNADDFETLE